MLLFEVILLCVLFFAICYIGTGGDNKNIKSYASYPDKVQEIVRARPELKDKIKVTPSWVTFLSNLVTFIIVLFILGLAVRRETYLENVLVLSVLGQTLNLFDFLVIDLLWWRNSARVRFTGTENQPELYRSPRKHFISFVKGIAVFLAAALLDAIVLTII